MSNRPIFSVLTVTQDAVSTIPVQATSTNLRNSNNRKHVDNSCVKSPKFSTDPMKGVYRSNQDPVYIGLVCSVNAIQNNDIVLSTEDISSKINLVSPLLLNNYDSYEDFDKNNDDDAMTLETVKSCSTMDYEENVIVRTEELGKFPSRNITVVASHNKRPKKNTLQNSYDSEAPHDISRKNTVADINNPFNTGKGANDKSIAIAYDQKVYKLVHLQEIMKTSKYQVLSLEPDKEFFSCAKSDAGSKVSEKKHRLSTEIMRNPGVYSSELDPSEVPLSLAAVDSCTPIRESIPEINENTATCERMISDLTSAANEEDLEIPPFIINESGTVVECSPPVAMIVSTVTPDDDEKTVKTKNTAKRSPDDDEKTVKTKNTTKRSPYSSFMDMNAIPEDIPSIVVESIKHGDIMVETPAIYTDHKNSFKSLIEESDTIIPADSSTRPKQTNRFQILDSFENGTIIPNTNGQDEEAPIERSSIIKSPFSSDPLKVTIVPILYEADPLSNRIKSYTKPTTESKTIENKCNLRVAAEGKNKSISSEEPQGKGSDNKVGLPVASEIASEIQDIVSGKSVDKNEIFIQKSETPDNTNLDPLVSTVVTTTPSSLEMDDVKSELNQESVIASAVALNQFNERGVVVTPDSENAETTVARKLAGSIPDDCALQSIGSHKGLPVLSLATEIESSSSVPTGSAQDNVESESEPLLPSVDGNLSTQDHATDESGGVALSVDPKSLVSTAIEQNVKTDITVYGCTSFTAKHVINYFMHTSLHLPNKVRITLGGRNREKLVALRDVVVDQMNNLCIIENNNISGVIFDIFVAESSDIQALTAMVKRTRIVLSCAGPFAQYSSNVVAACAANGTDYVDITGEVNWAGQMRIKHGEAAGQSGARIISFCGFDSVPSDLSIFAAVQALKEKSAVGRSLDIDEGSTWHYCEGGLNGGTIKTTMDYEMKWRHCLSQPVPFLVEDPLSLASPRKRFDPDFQQMKNRLAKAEWLNQLPNFDSFLMLGVSVPFFMAVINAKILHASALALNYGPNFVYRERYLPVGFKATTRLSVLSIIAAMILQVGVVLMLIIIKFPYFGERLINYFIPPGVGPSDDTCRHGTVEVYAQVTTSKDKHGKIHRANCYMKFVGDPGNYVTAQCVCESAWSLLLNRDELPKRSSDGFGTPAEMLGDVLLNRLKSSKVRPVVVSTNVRENVDYLEWRIHF